MARGISMLTAVPLGESFNQVADVARGDRCLDWDSAQDWPHQTSRQARCPRNTPVSRLRRAMTDLITPSRIPAGATPEGDGVITGDGPVRVDAFVDFLCPFCRRFELSAGPALADLIAEKLISLAHHPMNFLDQA